MKTRTAYAAAAFFRLVLICVIVGWAAFVLAYLVAQASGQQPGDTPAPVVDAFETGLLTAKITCKPTVQAGTWHILDISGSSTGETELIIRPAVPSGRIYRDSNGIHIAVWMDRTGHYGALWVVSPGPGEVVDAVAWDVVAGDVPEDPDAPPPGDTAFARYVREMLAEVEAADHDTVAATFRDLADRIGSVNPDTGKFEPGDLQSSTPIKVATLRALFGEEGTSRPEWSAWWEKVWKYMIDGHLDDPRIADQKAWATAYREIAGVLDNG